MGVRLNAEAELLAGRLISIERKPNASTAGERTFYTLDGAGNRIREELQRWNGSAWVPESATRYDYSTRCHLDRIRPRPGPARRERHRLRLRLQRQPELRVGLHPRPGHSCYRCMAVGASGAAPSEETRTTWRARGRSGGLTGTDLFLQAISQPAARLLEVVVAH